MEAIHVMRQMMEYYMARLRDLHMVFIDLKKPYDMVLREVLWWTRTKWGISKKYIYIMQYMYREVKMNVRTHG